MKAFVIAQHGPPEALQLQDVPMPQPGHDGVLVQNEIIGVNFVDTQHRAGLYYPIGLPLIPGVEAAGVVAAVGPEVSDFRVGDRVAYAGYMGGDYAEYTAVPQGRLVPVPAELPLEQAAASLMQGTTAYTLTHAVHPVGAGEVVVVHAAAGGTGLLLVQMAKRLGATVIGTTSSVRKAEQVRAAGADHVVVTGEPDSLGTILRLTGDEGAHVVFDGVGGEMMEASLGVLRTRGHLVEFGQSGGRPMPLDITRLSGITGSNNRGSLSITWASASDYLNTTAAMRAAAAAVFAAVQSGELKVHIAARYPFAEAAQAHRALESRSVSGKLLLIVDDQAASLAV